MFIGQKIKELRKKNDLTQEKLADYLCVSYQAISKWECGISSPDISLIGPLTKLFNISSDELLGLNKEKDDLRYKELEKLIEETWKTGDLKRRYEILKEAVNEYPGDMNFLNKLGWAEAMLSFDYEKDEDYIAAQEKAIKIFSRVIEDCEDKEIKNSAIFGIVQYLSFRKRYDEAKKYYELYPNDEVIKKEDLYEYCLVGEEKEKYKQEVLNKKILDLVMQIGYKNYNEQKAIIDVMIPDQNYQTYHEILVNNYLTRAKDMIIDNKEAAVEMLKVAKYHASEYDKCFKKGTFKFTSPFLNKVIIKSKDLCTSEMGTEVEYFISQAKDKRFSSLIDNQEYLKLIEK